MEVSNEKLEENHEETIEKTIRHYTKKLNYKLKQKDRIQFVENLLYDQKDKNKRLKSSFETYLHNYLNVNLNKNMPLSEQNPICKKLEVMANYILFSPDAERITKKTKYNFYSCKKLNKKMEREPSVEGLIEKFQNSSNDEIDTNIYDEVLDFLNRKGENYKKECKQKIFAKDYYDEDFSTIIYVDGVGHKTNYLEQYRIMDNYYSEKLKEMKLNNSPKYKQKQIGKMIYLLRKDQIDLKDRIKGTIYFKNVLPDTTCTDYQLFNFTDKEHIMALLKCLSNNTNDEIKILKMDLENLLFECKLNKDDWKALNLYSKDEFTLDEISEEFKGINKKNVLQRINKIANRVIKKYQERYYNWLNLNWVRGQYKTCSQCGEVKLVRYFSKDSGRVDKFDVYCKECRKSGKKG